MEKISNSWTWNLSACWNLSKICGYKIVCKWSKFLTTTNAYRSTIYNCFKSLQKKITEENCEFFYFFNRLSLFLTIIFFNVQFLKLFQPIWDLHKILVWSHLRMRSRLGVRASDCQCTSCNGPGFDPSIRRHSGIWGAADKQCWIMYEQKEKNPAKKYLKKKILV